MLKAFSQTNAVAVLLILLGVSRMLFIKNRIEIDHSWILSIAPKPQVFINPNYYHKKIFRVYKKDQTFIDIDFEQNHSWPFKDELIASYYPLLRVLDRPEFTPPRVWNHYVDFFICKKNGDIFKAQFPLNEIIGANSYIQTANGNWKQVQGFLCH